MMSEYTELKLIEQPAVELFADLGWETLDRYDERFGSGGTLGRETEQGVVLVPGLREALRRLNPELPAASIDEAVEAIARYSA